MKLTADWSSSSLLTWNENIKKFELFLKSKEQTWTGGRDKVEFYKVDKRFWHVNLGRNWRSHSMSTRFDYVVYVDLNDIVKMCQN